jgi:hypothetical protein
MISGHGRKRFLSAMAGRSSKMPVKPASKTTVSRRVFGHRRKTAIRAGLYARISTHDQQTLSLQRRAMRDYATCGWRITKNVEFYGFYWFPSV